MATLDIPATDPLTFSRVQAFFNRLYPETGGFAIENLGSTTNNQGDFLTFPTGTPEAIYGQSAGITYTPAIGGSGLPEPMTGRNRGTPGIFTNNTGSAIDLTNATMEIDVTFDNIPSNRSNLAISAVITNPGTTSIGDGNLQNEVVMGTITITQTGTATIRATATGNHTSWADTNVIGVYLTAPSASTIQPFTYTVHAVRISYSSAAFQRNTERLSAYNRGGGIVPATMTGEPAYPATGGIATDDVGSRTHAAGTNYSWPLTAATLEGATNGFRYAAGTNINDFGVNGQIFNETGANIDLRNLNITVRVTYTDINNGATPFLWFRNNGATAWFSNPAVTQGTQVAYTGTASAGAAIWINGQAIQFLIFDTSSNRPFDYTVDNIRINLNSSATEFVPTGGGTVDINTGISDNGNMVVLSSLRGVDDGVEEPARQTRAAPAEDPQPPIDPNAPVPPGPDGVVRGGSTT